MSKKAQRQKWGRVLVPMPEEWLQALRDRAERLGMPLSELIRQGSLQMLTKAERAKLPPAQETRGRAQGS